MTVHALRLDARFPSADALAAALGTSSTDASASPGGGIPRTLPRGHGDIGAIVQWIKEQEQTRENTLIRNMDYRSKFSEEVDEMIRTACRRWDGVASLAREERVDPKLLITMFGDQIGRARYWAERRQILQGDFDAFAWLAGQVPSAVSKDVKSSIERAR